MPDGVENEMTPASEAKPDRAETETRDAVEAAITDRTRFLWYPAEEQPNFEDKRY